MWLLYLGDAGLLVTSGLIHLHLWDIAYRHVKTLDVLFLVQVAACLLAALRDRLAAAKNSAAELNGPPVRDSQGRPRAR
jgi:hypothetical protein